MFFSSVSLKVKMVIAHNKNMLEVSAVTPNKDPNIPQKTAQKTFTSLA